MKPRDWNDLSTDERRAMASNLLNSVRGRLIMGQALAKAAAVMRTEEYPETSNIEDMEMLGELFEPFYSMYTPEGEAIRQRAFDAFKANKEEAP